MKKIIFAFAALAVLTFSRAQEKCNSIPFIYHSHIYIPVVINDSVECNVIYDTGAAGMFGVDSVFLSHSAWKPATPEGPTYDYGFRNRTDIYRGWIVSSLVRDGEAVKAGLQLGDTITTVNGQSVSEYSWDEEDNLHRTPKQILTIATANGQEKQITLEAKEQW